MAAPVLDAVILAAGMGTRMRSSLPKMMHPVMGRPMVSYPVEAALAAGAGRVVVVVGHGAEVVTSYLAERFGDQVVFARQPEPKGTADAVRAALPALEGRSLPRLILNGDLPLLRPEDLAPLLALLPEVTRGALLLGLATFLPGDPTGYGRAVRGPGGALLRVVEHKDASPEERKIREVNAGLYLVDASFLEQGLSRVESHNAQREFYLPDLVEMASQTHQARAVVLDAECVSGVNDRAELAQVERVARLRRNQALMRAGVTMLDPERCYVSLESEVACDVILAANVSLYGATKLGRGTRVGEGCVLTDTVIAEEVELRPYCVADRATIEAGAVVGPFAHLRPKASLGPKVHIGNFVEVKNTRLGAGSKANHLSYLGDAEIGAGVNVGAGCITCNYDGVHKHKTEIGDGVFVGSDVQLVAPVKVGRGAVIAAGSCITEEVPADALALTRVKQENRAGGALRYWAKRRAK